MTKISTAVMTTALLVLLTNAETLHGSFLSSSSDISSDSSFDIAKMSVKSVMDINNILNPLESSKAPSPIGKRTFLEYNADYSQDDADVDAPPAKKAKKNSSRYSHLEEYQKKMIYDFIENNQDPSNKAISDFAISKGMDLSIRAANRLKHNYYLSTKFLPRLSQDEKKTVGKYIKNNPSSDAEAIYEFAKLMGMDLDINSAERLRRIYSKPSVQYSHLTPEQQETILKYIEEHPKATGELISNYASTIGVLLNSAAANKLRLNEKKPSDLCADLTNGQRNKIKQFINNNPQASRQEVSEFANKEGILLTPKAASYFMQCSGSYEHLNDDDKKIVVIYIKEHPDATGCTISNFAKSKGIHLTNRAAGNLKHVLNRESYSYSHLEKEEKKKLRQHVKNNPHITGKNLSIYAKTIGITISIPAAGSFIYNQSKKNHVRTAKKP